MGHGCRVYWIELKDAFDLRNTHKRNATSRVLTAARRAHVWVPITLPEVVGVRWKGAFLAPVTVLAFRAGFVLAAESLLGVTWRGPRRASSMICKCNWENWLAYASRPRDSRGPHVRAAPWVKTGYAANSWSRCLLSADQGVGAQRRVAAVTVHEHIDTMTPWCAGFVAETSLKFHFHFYVNGKIRVQMKSFSHFYIHKNDAKMGNAL